MNHQFHSGYNTIVSLTPQSPDAPQLTQKYRRNGKLQSCEPCRKSKLRCDHAFPTCGRCAKRRKLDQCFYHDAPLTRKRDHSFPLPSPSTGSSAVSPVVAASVEPSVPQHLAHTSFETHPLPPSRARAASAPPVVLDDRHEDATKTNAGFLGSTSFDSIFKENSERLGIYTSNRPASSQSRTFTVTRDDILRGTKMLSFLRHRLMVNQFINRYQEQMAESGDAVLSPIMKHWLRDLWVAHGNVLQEQNEDKIQKLCETIWRNTQTPLVFDGNTSPSQYASLSTGHSLRWAVVGSIAVEIGLCAQSLGPSDSLFREHDITRDVLSNCMYDVAETCLAFCRKCDIKDDTFLWLLQELPILTGSLQGMGSYNIYQQVGELTSVIFFMGFHQEIVPNAETPFFLAEVRKRCRLQSYYDEISVACTLGRPCRISHRYMDPGLPLDLTDAELYAGRGEVLDAALAGLDADGWSLTGRWTRNTALRASAYHAHSREDILDLTFGKYSREEVIARAAGIKKTYDEAWAHVPKGLQELRETPAATISGSLLDTLYRCGVRQGFLANEMLLQRLLIQKAGAQADELIHAARLMFKECMHICSHPDILKDFTLDFVYILTSHGLRAAAILAVELLKQEQLPVYPTNPRLPRSETIQDLSVFNSRLAVVESNSGMFAFFERARRVISGILDKILAPPSTQQFASGGGYMASERLLGSDAISQLPSDSLLFPDGDFGTDDLNVPLGMGNDVEFLDWLENMDWERGGAGVPGMGIG